MICLWIGKTYTAKTPPGDFKVTTPENSLLSKQAVTSKGISVPYTNLQLNPYSNTQLDLFYSDNLSFQFTAPSTWLTNCANPNTRLDHQLEKDVGCKILLFITRWRSWNFLVTKPKTTPPFCHEWQRVRVSSRHPVIAGWTSIPISSSLSSSDALGGGEGDSMKPPRRACRLAIQPTRVFTWHNSSLRVSRRVSRRASMC